MFSVVQEESLSFGEYVLSELLLYDVDEVVVGWEIVAGTTGRLLR